MIVYSIFIESSKQGTIDFCFIKSVTAILRYFISTLVLWVAPHCSVGRIVLERKILCEIDFKKKNHGYTFSFQSKMLNTLYSREKILGNVIGKLTIAQIDEEIISQEFLLSPLTLLVNQLNDEFYLKARKMPIDKFWRDFLRSNWEKKEKIATESEELQEMANILASIFYHKPEMSKTE